MSKIHCNIHYNTMKLNDLKREAGLQSDPKRRTSSKVYLIRRTRSKVYLLQVKKIFKDHLFKGNINMENTGRSNSFVVTHTLFTCNIITVLPWNWRLEFQRQDAQSPLTCTLHT